MHCSKAARDAATDCRLTCAFRLCDLWVVAFVNRTGGHGRSLLGGEASECDPQHCPLPGRVQPRHNLCGLVRRGCDSESLAGACLNRPSSLPVAEQVTASHRKPGPKRSVVGETHPPAMHDQPRKSLLRGIKCRVFARTLLLEVAHEARRIPVIDQSRRLRLAPKGLEQVTVRRTFRAHHLQTNTPPDL